MDIEISKHVKCTLWTFIILLITAPITLVTTLDVFTYKRIDRSYRSDDTEDAVTTDNPTTPFPTPPPTLVSPRSPLPLHRQASPFPLENTNSRRIIYATPQDRLRGNNGEVVYASNKKTQSNSTLGRTGRNRHRGAGGMTSSSSATSCNSCIDRSYRSDDTEDAVTTDNPTTPFPTPPPTLVSPRSPLPLHRQASPFPLENTNSRRIIYATPQDRLRGNNGEVVYASNKKTQSNSTLGRTGRNRHRGAGGMTSSSSATSCNSCTEGGRNDITYHAEQHQRLCLNNDVNEESPPEPAPPEVPPRGPSLHSATLRRRADYNLPVGEANQGGQDTTAATQYLSQGGK
ncbi:hypothetical protein QE152_g32013 [Popillia japonica]|uniref:Uncharacterized protein n=1 Tax=Popillia japonica TaxID=7064 RepID=A0AAW1J0N7_POPJA